MYSKTKLCENRVKGRFSASFKLLLRFCIKSVVCFIASLFKNMSVNRYLTNINQYLLVSLC